MSHFGIQAFDKSTNIQISNIEIEKAEIDFIQEQWSGSLKVCAIQFRLAPQLHS